MWLSLIILALAVPVGFWIAWLARDELVAGRRWFFLAIIGGLALALGAGAMHEAAGAYTGAFIAILATIAYRKSFDRRWTQTRGSDRLV